MKCTGLGRLEWGIGEWGQKGVGLGGNERILKLIMMMGVQLRK